MFTTSSCFLVFSIPDAGFSTGTITGDDVYNRQEEKLGTIQDIMIDLHSGRIRYAVLSSGGFLGMGDHLFAIPWDAFKIDKANKRFLLNVKAEYLKKAPGFDKDNWPNMADPKWNNTIESYFEKNKHTAVN